MTNVPQGPTQPPDRPDDERTPEQIRTEALEALREPETFARALQDYDKDGSLRWELAKALQAWIEERTMLHSVLEDRELREAHKSAREVLADAVVDGEIVVKGVNS